MPSMVFRAFVGWKSTGFCIRYLECVRELKMETPKPIDIEALFETFVAEFPVLSALDLFCNRCGRPMALTYGISDLRFFYAEFFCRDAAHRVHLAVENFARGARLNRDTVLATIDMVRGGQLMN
jgi:hypothetical protein